MGKYKVSRKQLLKEPDEFISLSAKTILFLSTHRKAMVISLIVFVALVAGAAGYRVLDNRWEAAASVAAQDIVGRYQKALADGQSASSALATVDAAMADLLKRYGGQAAGKLGRLFLADAKLAAGSPAEAIALYREAVGYFDPSSFFRYRIFHSQAQAHLALKQYDQAVELLQQVADGTGPGMADAALFEMGLVFAATGDAARSDAAFEALKEKYPESQYVQRIASAGRA